MIWSHMWRTRASVMLLSRVALTTPAIPHIAWLLLLHTDTGHTGTGHSGTDRKGDRERIRLLPPSGRQIPETFEAIIAIVTRISLAAVTRSEQDVGHLPRGNKVQRFLSTGRAADQGSKKVAKAFADNGVFLGRVHAMTMQFNEQPVRTSEHANLRLLPEREPMQGRRHGSGKGGVVESGADGTEGTPEVHHERTLDHQRKSLGHASGNQVVPPAVRCCLIERKSAFVDGIDFFDLRRIPGSARHGEVGVAAGLSQNLHFRIDATAAPGSGVGERKISVHKGVGGTSGTIFDGEAAMLQGQPIAEFSEQPASVLGSVGIGNSVVQMDLDFSPAGMAMLGEHLDQPLVVLLGRVEVGVDKRTAIVVSPAVDDFGIFARPPLQPAFLLRTRGARLAATGNNGRFEMVGQGKDEMHGALGWRFQGMPGRGRQDFPGVSELLLKTHVEI